MNNQEQTPKKKNGLPRWIFILSLTTLVSFLVFLGYGMVRKTNPTMKVGDPVPDFTVETFDGQTINLADQRGKVILVHFWASWCLSCEDEALLLEQIWQEVKGRDDILFLGIDYVDTRTEALAYMEKYKITFPNAPDLETKISRLFRLRGVPETYVIDDEGILAGSRIGPFSAAEELRELLDSAQN